MKPVKPFCVFLNMDVSEIMFVTLGFMVSVVAFFLKKESSKVERLNEKLRSVEILLAKNGAQDTERWNQTKKLLEDRRQDIMKIYGDINR